MGSSYHVTCVQCGHTFDVMKGDGWYFHLLRCDSCGLVRTVNFKEVKEARLRLIKGGPEPLRTRAFDDFTTWLKAAQPKTPFWSKFRGKKASTDLDNEIKDIYARAPFSAEEYRKAVERVAGTCPHCGGSFKFDAPPRCPKCRSTELKYDTAPFVMYD